ncbi:MAG: 1-acyl-sn-glycerol-3-phosphate acyltransferase [Flavobacteriales bacterium]|nr:1-acyl-sn-glycerol-3-phosphate acyltransferase [Flavobacteriales bacterium]
MWKLISCIQIVFVIFITLFCGVVGSVVMLLTFTPKIAMNFFPNLWSRFLFFIFGVRLQIDGKPVDSTPAIYAANHASPLDIPVSFLTTPGGGYFIAKKELKKIPVFGWYMILSGMIFIDRSNKETAMKSMLSAGEEVKKGKNVIAYPEGTRSKDGNMMRFKRGSFLLSKEADIPIQLAVIKGAFDRMTSKDWQCNPGTIHFKYLNKISWDSNQYDSPEDYANQTQVLVTKAHSEMA